jgi:NADPH:quinone reductase
VRAVVLSETGAPERLEVQEVPEPEPQEGEVVLDVHAAGINYADVLIRRGAYPQPPPLPTILGSEVAGEVAGARVMALTRATGGGYAERVAVDREALVSLPDGATFAEGASFMLTFLTAWLPLTRQARVGEGSTVLVHAAAGGVGSAAVQVARHLGARVVATASTDEKRRVALDLGAEEAYGYEEFADAVRADVVVDPVGGEVFERSLRTLRPLGAIVAIGFAGGAWKPVDPAFLVGRNISVLGFYFGRLLARDPELVAPALREVVELWRSGAVRPLVGAEFPLERAADAHRLIESRQSHGKVVLVP